MDLLALVGFQTVDSWIEAGGYAMLFGILFACGLGLPVPEDIPLMVAGALVAKGQMHLVPAAIAAWCGIIGGDIILYHLGKTLGVGVTKVRFIGKHLTPERIERVERMYDKYGIGVVAVGRLFAGIRAAVVVAAGAIRFNFLKFLITDGLAALVSGGFFIFVGHWLGTRLNAETVERFKHEVSHWLLLILLVALIVVLAWIFWRRKKAEDRMEKVTTKVERVVDRVAHPIKHATPPPSQPAASPQSRE
jgi:membrane protein DedA with SNARE-associated domain